MNLEACFDSDPPNSPSFSFDFQLSTSSELRLNRLHDVVARYEPRDVFHLLAVPAQQDARRIAKQSAEFVSRRIVPDHNRIIHRRFPGIRIELFLLHKRRDRAASFIVRSLSIERLRWLVVIVVIYAAVLMLLSARMRAAAAG